MAHDSVTTEQAEALDLTLRSFFRSLEARALPDSLRVGSPGNLFDQLSAAPAFEAQRRRA